MLAKLKAYLDNLLSHDRLVLERLDTMRETMADLVRAARDDRIVLDNTITARLDDIEASLAELLRRTPEPMQPLPRRRRQAARVSRADAAVEREIDTIEKFANQEPAKYRPLSVAEALLAQAEEKK